MRQLNLILFLFCILHAPSAHGYTFAMVGDSITESTSWVSQFTALVGSGHKVINCGKSGRTLRQDVGDTYWTSDSWNRAQTSNPDFVFIMLGTNDAKTFNWDRSKYTESYYKMIKTLRSTSPLPRFVLASPPTAFRSNFEIQPSVVNNDLPNIVRDIAQATESYYINMNAATKNDSRFYGDGIHPDDGGSKTIAQTFLNAYRAAIPVTSCAGVEWMVTRAATSMVDKFYNGYFKEQWPDKNDLTGYWTNAQASDACADAVVTENNNGHYAKNYWLNNLLDSRANRGLLINFYDDMDWQAAFTARVYTIASVRGDFPLRDKALSQLKTIYSDIQGGYDTSCCGGRNSGLWWDKAHTQKATASNAGTVIVSVHLYQITGDRSYLDYAYFLFNPWAEYMTDPNTGECYDHITNKGEIVKWRFTYNYGLMIGASVMLYNAQPSHRDQWEQAKSYVRYMLKSPLVINTPNGPTLNDGTKDSCAGDCQQFKGPTARYLRLFYQVGLKYNPTEPLLASVYTLLKGSAFSVASTGINWNDFTFGVPWQGPAPSRPVNIMQMNSAVQALGAFAEVCRMTPPQKCPNSVGVGLVSAGGVSQIVSTGGGNVTSPSCNLYLTVQPDGNMVIYDNSRRVYWAAMCFGQGPHTLVLQPDGNLVVYDNQRRAIWASGTWRSNGQAPYFLSLDDQATLTIRDNGGLIIWSNK